MNIRRHSLSLPGLLLLGLLLLGLLPLTLWSGLADAASVTDLRADSASLDGKTGQYRYHGNAMLSQDNFRISADDMHVTQDENGNLKSGRFRGAPAVLEHTDSTTGAKSEARADEIVYDTSNGRIELIGEALLVQHDPKLNRQMRLQASHILLIETGQQLNDLSATGSPALFSRQEEGALPIEGQAEQLRYVGAKEQLSLEGQAKLQQGKTTFEHVIIEYDGLRKLITAPKRDGQQVKITRTPEEQPAGTSNKPAVKTEIPDVSAPKPDTTEKDKL